MKGKKLLDIIRAINIITSLILIVLSALSLAFVVVAAITSFKLFLVFSPLFMIAFGVAMLAAEFKVKIVLKKLPFLKSLLGRGLFNIYLSSILYYYFEASDQTVLAWVGALSLFISGFIYIGMHFGCGKQLEKQTEKPTRDDGQDVDRFKEPLM